MADFSHVQTVLPAGGGGGSSGGVGLHNRKAAVQIRVAGSSDLLVITCPSLIVAENLADLVVGYCRLVNNSSTSIWTRKGTSFPTNNLALKLRPVCTCVLKVCFYMFNKRVKQCCF